MYRIARSSLLEWPESVAPILTRDVPEPPPSIRTHSVWDAICVTVRPRQGGKRSVTPTVRRAL